MTSCDYVAERPPCLIKKKPPQPRVTVAGFDVTPTRPKTELVKQEKPYREIVAIVTAYCPCARCCGRMTGQTKTKTNAWKPGVAVCEEVIPYGSLVHVPGYERDEFAVADDTGGAMRKAWRSRREVHVDVRMTYQWQARNWGNQVLLIRVYDVKGEQDER